MKRITLLFLAWGVEVLAFQKWFNCWLFKDVFYFTPQTLINQLSDAQNASKGLPLTLIRALHNKIFTLGWGLLQTLLQYWDIRFLEAFIGVVGAVGVGMGIWYLFTKGRKSMFAWVLFSLGIIFPLIELYFQPHVIFAWVLYAFGFIFQTISLYGIWQFLGKSSWQRYIFVIVLLVVSLMVLLLLPLSYLDFCLKI